jgi:hypothetical protein
MIQFASIQAPEYPFYDKLFTCVNDTSDKLITSVIVTGKKFIAGVNKVLARYLIDFMTLAINLSAVTTPMVLTTAMNTVATISARLHFKANIKEKIITLH